MSGRGHWEVFGFLRAIAARSPIAFEGPFADPRCVFCDCRSWERLPWGADKDRLIRIYEHQPDCPWMATVETVGGSFFLNGSGSLAYAHAYITNNKEQS